ncbi:hypothetical protein CEXT_256091 [Caerostris extrusa]|uniref:Uncharacterized protein n=1 Tax=Caerostris extrusa TaxID=172846 RepID=A0AAV4SQM7_CAEEX|nr:hypothetical protein CEXT_256091 [Caerostris extrusa]
MSTHSSTHTTLVASLMLSRHHSRLLWSWHHLISVAPKSHAIFKLDAKEQLFAKIHLRPSEAAFNMPRGLAGRPWPIWMVRPGAAVVIMGWWLQQGMCC